MAAILDRYLAASIPLTKARDGDDKRLRPRLAGAGRCRWASSRRVCDRVRMIVITPTTPIGPNSVGRSGRPA